MENQKGMTINLIKVYTMFLVVIGHCTRIYTSKGAISTVGSFELFEKITNFIYYFHMPLFFFISGYVYFICINKGKYKDHFKFIKNKLLRLIIPYLFIGVFYVAPVVSLLNISNNSFIHYIFSNILLLRDSRHLWFLPVLFTMFVLINPLQKITNSKNNILLLLLFVLSNLLSSKIPISFLSNVANYFLYFYIGLLSSYYYKELSREKCMFICALLSVLYILLFIIDVTIVPIMAILGIFSTCFFIRSLDVKSLIEKKLYLILNKYSMGVYLFHPMLIYIYFSISITNCINPMINCIIAFLLSYILSLMITKLFFKLRIQFLIGEN